MCRETARETDAGNVGHQSSVTAVADLSGVPVRGRRRTGGRPRASTGAIPELTEQGSFL